MATIRDSARSQRHTVVVADSSGLAGETLNAMQTIQAFTMEDQQGRRYTAAVEQSFVAELHDPSTGEVLEETLVGTFDLVLHEGARQIVCEHKTSGRRYSDDQLKNDLQLTAYQLAARQIEHGDVRKHHTDEQKRH